MTDKTERNALKEVRDFLAHAPIDCLGEGRTADGQTYPIRDEVIDCITKALAAPAEGGQGEVVDLGEVIREKVREHGSYRAASKAIGVNYPYLCQMAHDPNRKPSKEILAALGLERVTVTRRLIDSAGGAKGNWRCACGDMNAQNETCGICNQSAPQPAEGDGVEHEGDTCRSNDLYAGNSVGWWKSKADNYKNGLLKVCDALGSIGVKMDGNTPCWEYVAALTRPSATAAVPEGCTPEDARMLRAANHGLAEESARFREALEYYANRHHFAISDSEVWDTVSGEPENLWCDEAGTATVEDGAVARHALAAAPAAHKCCNCLGIDPGSCAFNCTPAAPKGDDSHAFKNFHRMLCERFGYTHDEKDWRRDQVSLMEHIARGAAPKGGVVDALCREARELQRKNYGSGAGLHLDMIDWARKYDAALANQEQRHDALADGEAASD